jgi:hypothetical protein
MAGVKRDELLKKPSLLKVVFERLRIIQAQRTTSGVSRGQADLLESAIKVAKSQAATQRARRHFTEKVFPQLRERYETKLRHAGE